MKELDSDRNEPMKVKINIKKFLQALYLETIEKFFGHS
ncbi:hypothetical protein [Bacillus sp. PK3_68]